MLLSQAAGSTNYFEDAFLARYLGYTLAEAGDLAVRQNQAVPEDARRAVAGRRAVAATQQRELRSAGTCRDVDARASPD